MLTTDLTGKRALVTGGASGIGLATAELFAQCGATVAINHLADDKRGTTEVERLKDAGFDVYAAGGNVADADDCHRMVKQAVNELGGLDILINNAGTSNTVEPVPFEDMDAMTEAFWNTILATNLLGPWRCAHAAAAALRDGGGAVVNTASIAGLDSRGSSIAYGASKAALINLTKNLARALAPTVRVNAVAPGLVRSPWTEPWPEERKQKHIQSSLLQRYVETEDIAQTMLFLSTHPAITAVTVPVDCGRNG